MKGSMFSSTRATFTPPGKASLKGYRELKPPKRIQSGTRFFRATPFGRLLSECLRMVNNLQSRTRVATSRARIDSHSFAPLNARTAALSKALDEERGARARAVHLVIVEQTLVQGIWGGLSAIPAAVLELAMPQLASLEHFRNSRELQLLLECMHRAVDAHSMAEIPAKRRTDVQAERCPRPQRPETTTASAILERGRIHRLSGSSDSPPEDDFPDTEAFEDGSFDLLIPIFDVPAPATGSQR